MSPPTDLIAGIISRDPRAIARAISIVENGESRADEIMTSLDRNLLEKATVIGLTGPPGAGKSTLADRLIAHYRRQGRRVGVIAIDPSSPISGGAILGDRIRMMKHVMDPDVLLRSMATRGRLGGLCAAAGATARIMAGSGCDIIMIETVGVGQSEMDIIRLADITALVLAPGLGDDIQAMKAGLLEVADILVVNKADCPGAEALALDLETASRDRQSPEDAKIGICLTAASEDRGTSELAEMIDALDKKHRHGDEHVSRRRLSRIMEVVDWSLELLRPRLQSLVAKEDVLETGDPRKLAIRITDELTKRNSSN